MVNGSVESKHLGKESEKPDASQEGVPRVYGSKFDPFTQRVQLILAAKGIEFENLNINLQSKPSWFLAKNPRGNVPLVELDGNMITDSVVASVYVDEVCSGKKMLTTDSFKKAKEAKLLQDCEKMVSGYHDAVFLVDEKPGIGMITMKEGLEFIDRFLQRNKTEYVCGEEPGFADFMIWPHLERIGAMWPLCITQYTFVEEYFNRMGDHDAVKKCRVSDQLHRKFIRGIRKNVYNYNLKEDVEEKNLEKEVEKPDAPQEGVPRVYGTKFDPFTQRVQLALAAKNVQFENFNIGLKNKPSWFLLKNPRGSVPLLELNGNMVTDSVVASVYVDEVCSGRKLLPTDALKKAKEAELLQDCQKMVSGYHDAVFLVDEKPGIGMITMKEGLEFIDRFLQHNKTEYVCGEEPGFADFMLWPHLERIGAMWPLCITQYAFVEEYFNRMGDHDVVKKCRVSDQLHRKYIRGIRKNVYNYNLKEVEE